ncbi:PREDICTED: uncharacterized protein LOC107337687 [Acropora digitifera]|uniref:uncharacterized protein LOC107337687 n=1 Tax=Acropora digitifera TaxID=70779 RepID=UPI00077A3319|nr:PREDICTED: uncharacterized protein LOC107337687 [Acropora digitifera]
MSKLRFINYSVKEALLAIPNSFSSRPQLVWCQLVLRTLKTHDQLLFERKLEHSTESHGTQRHEPYPSYTDYTDGWLTPPLQERGVSPGPMPFPTPLEVDEEDLKHPKSTEDSQCVIS